MQPIYPLSVACFLAIPYPSIGPEGMQTPRSIPSATVSRPILRLFGLAYLMSGPRYHSPTPSLSTRLGVVCLGTSGLPWTRFGNRNGWSPDITPPSRVLRPRSTGHKRLEGHRPNPSRCSWVRLVELPYFGRGCHVLLCYPSVLLIPVPLPLH